MFIGLLTLVPTGLSQLELELICKMNLSPLGESSALIKQVSDRKIGKKEKNMYLSLFESVSDQYKQP